MNVANALVYNDQLQCGSEEVANGCLHLPFLPSSQATGHLIDKILAPQLPVLFLGTDGCLDATENVIGGQVCNRFEAELTAKLAIRLIEVCSLSSLWWCKLITWFNFMAN